MTMGEDYSRMIDKEHKPTEKEMVSFIGEKAKESWLETRRFIEDNYEILPDTVFYGAKYGWTIRYRKSGRTLCSLFPEKGGFSVLIVLGRRESEEALSIRNELSSRIYELLENTKQLHDGRWLWIRLSTTSDTDDIKKLLKIKRKPKKIKTSEPT